MRLGKGLIMAGIAVLATFPAHAQTSYQATAPSGGYVYMGGTGNTAGAYNAPPVYNTNAQPLVKGRNAPSYNFRGSTSAQPYNFGTTTAKSGPMTVEQADQLRAMRDAQAAQYEQELVARINAQNANPNGQAQGVGNLQTMYGQLLPGQQAQQPQRKKRVIYREEDNPLHAPPRLFNPDQ